MSGATDDDRAGYGPVALYIGSGEVTFRNVAFKDLLPKYEPKEQLSSRFHMQRLNEFYYAWCAAVADINRDGDPDVGGRPFYYTRARLHHAREIYRSAQASTIPPPSTPPRHGELRRRLHRRRLARRADADLGRADVPLCESARANRAAGTSTRWCPRSRPRSSLLKDMDGDGKPEFVYGGRSAACLCQAGPGQSDRAVDRASRSPSRSHRATSTAWAWAISTATAALDMLGAYGWWEQPPAGSKRAVDVPSAGLRPRTRPRRAARDGGL